MAGIGSSTATRSGSRGSRLKRIQGGDKPAWAHLKIAHPRSDNASWPITTKLRCAEPAFHGRDFASTHWSVVLLAGREHSPKTAEALEKLCQSYWYPLYAFSRRRGYGPQEAADLTQEFFSRLLETNALASVDRRKGSALSACGLP